MPKQLNHSETNNLYFSKQICVVCDSVVLPANIGMICRVCEAMGVCKVYICGTHEALNSKKVLKTSRSTSKLLKIERFESALHCVNSLKDDGYSIVSLELTDKSIDLRKMNFNLFDKIALIVGAENRGVNNSILQETDCCTFIPMFGSNSSMNVATALSIALFELVRQTL